MTILVTYVLSFRHSLFQFMYCRKVFSQCNYSAIAVKHITSSWQNENVVIIYMYQLTAIMSKWGAYIVSIASFKAKILLHPRISNEWPLEV